MISRFYYSKCYLLYSLIIGKSKRNLAKFETLLMSSWTISIVSNISYMSTSLQVISYVKIKNNNLAAMSSRGEMSVTRKRMNSSSDLRPNYHSSKALFTFTTTLVPEHLMA